MTRLFLDPGWEGDTYRKIYPTDCSFVLQDRFLMFVDGDDDDDDEK
jgi:hypothetical protein